MPGNAATYSLQAYSSGRGECSLRPKRSSPAADVDEALVLQLVQGLADRGLRGTDHGRHLALGKAYRQGQRLFPGGRVAQALVHQREQQTADPVVDIAGLGAEAVAQIAQTAAHDGDDPPCQGVIAGQQIVERLPVQPEDDGRGLGIDLTGQVLQDLRQAEDLARGAQEKSGFLSGLGHAKDAQQPGRHIKTGPARVAFKKNDVVLFQFDALGTAQKVFLALFYAVEEIPFFQMPETAHAASRAPGP